MDYFYDDVTRGAGDLYVYGFFCCCAVQVFVSSIHSEKGVSQNTAKVLIFEEIKIIVVIL